MANITPEYIAGFFDGEGSVSLRNHTCRDGCISSQVFVCITNTNRDVLEAIREHVGVGQIYNKRVYSLRHRKTYSWACTSRDAVKFLGIIRPHLIIKGAQADLALRFAATMLPTTKGKPRRVAPEVKLARLAMAVEIKALNRPPIVIAS